MLVLKGILGGSQKQPQQKIRFLRQTIASKILRVGAMLIVLIAFFEKVAQTGEMLIMLIILGPFREGMHGKGGQKSQK